MTTLRQSAREAGVYLRVVRNTLLTRAVEGTDFACMNDVFVGPTLIAFSNEHPGAAARLFKEFAKGNDKFSIKGGAFQGEFIPAAQIDRLATLPTYEEAIAKLMATMKEASAGKTGSYSGSSARQERSQKRLNSCNRTDYFIFNTSTTGFFSCLSLKTKSSKPLLLCP